MHILTVGVNHRTAPVEVREKLAFTSDRLPHALAVLKDTKSVLECVIVGTCNRTEIYVVVDRQYKSGHFVRGFLEHWFHVKRDEFDPYLYMLEDSLAVEHLFRVACGLDSMMIGETQILGQVRDAFLLAQKQGATGVWFNTLFKQAITLAKRAHSETAIGENPVSVSYAAVELGKRILDGLRGKNVLLIGAGKTSELAARHLFAEGVGTIRVVNRTFSHAALLAGKFNGQAYPLERMLEALADSDFVISASGSGAYVLLKKQVEDTLSNRRPARPLFMVDIAVPRNLDPAIGELSGVFLHDLDDLEFMVESNLAERRKEADKIGLMIAREVQQFGQWLKMLGVTPVIRALQEKSNRIYEETMESMMKKLPDLDEREEKVIRKLARSIVNQMMRDPILRVKEMAGGSKGREALAAFTELFALEDILAEEELKEGEAQWADMAARPVFRRDHESGVPSLSEANDAQALAGS